PAQRCFGARRLLLRDTGALLGTDLGENVAHAVLLLVAAIKRSSTRRAAPLSIDRAANSAPSRNEAARPATISEAALFSSATSRSGPGLPPSRSRIRAAL